jgi:tetratricopeptide (TPR) repeat protein
MTDRLAQLLALLDAEPGDAFCLYGIAQEHAKRGDDRIAIEYYDRTIAADPDSLYAYYHKARSQQALDDDAGAAISLRAGLARARAAGDTKAAGELAALLDELT